MTMHVAVEWGVLHCYKLIKTGSMEKYYNLFGVCITIKCCVKHFNSLSDFFECEMGLLQGEILSPILFSLFLNDVEMCLQEESNVGITTDQLSIYLLLFADDAVIMSETLEGLLEALLNQLEIYCNKWNLVVNIDKTKVMIFKKGGLKSNIQFSS